jgi:DNA-binding LytR/AlgR family response regulator
MNPDAGPTGTMPENRLLVWSSHGIEIINYDDIVFLEADKNYTIIETCRGENILSSRSLGRIEAGLPQGKFARISRKHIVNEKYLKSVNFKDKTCVLESGQGRKKLKYTRKLGDFISEKDEPACKS